MKQYRIDPNLNIPIYQQLVDAIRADIKKGALPDGTQLPTVQTLAEELGIARGTIKRAYDLLAQQGLVQLVQGRGTFVSYQPLSAASRKEQAMAAIDGLLDQLEDMGLPMSEIGIFVNLKLRQRAEQLSRINIAVVECNPESLARLSHQLRKLEQVEVFSYLLQTIEEYPYKLDEDLDLIVTTLEHAEFLQNVVPDRKKIARIALRLSPKSMAQLVKLPAGETLGILTCSKRFGDLLYTACEHYADQPELAQPELFSQDLDIPNFFHDKTAVLVPKDWETYCTDSQCRAIHMYARQHMLIPCCYEMDEGSLLYLQEKISRLREKRSI